MRDDKLARYRKGDLDCDDGSGLFSSYTAMSGRNRRGSK
jgi:hypothetical protein